MRSRTLTLLICTAVFGTASTAQGPTLLKDINPTGGSNANYLTCFGDVVYFNANDGVHGSELWKTDGTESGTVMIKDLNVGTGSGFPKDFMEMNGLIYFSATDAVNGVQLWRTDGTESGTQVVLSLGDVDGLTSWMYFVVLGDRIFFRGSDAVAGSELWSTDGTAAGTQLFLDINPGTVNSSIEDPLVYDGKLYFGAGNATSGLEPWVCDGTVGGTHVISDIAPGVFSSDPSDFIGAGGLVFFRANTSAQGAEMWVTDGTEAGTHLIKDIQPGPNGSLPSNMSEHNGLLYFRAYTTQSANFIWQSDGTLAGTVALPMPTYDYNLAQHLCSHDGWLYFTGFGDFHEQLWRTDGTAANTQEILFPGSDVLQPFSNSTKMRSCNGDLFFRSAYMTATGSELYTLSLPTGTEEHIEDIIQIYPNPATDQVVVQLARSTNAKLLDNSGRVVRAWRLSAGPNTLNLTDLANGAYMMVTEAGAYRIMKQ